MVSFYKNTTTQILCGPLWEILLKRIGQPVMMHLLLHCAMFVPLPNNCYLQVCGRPIHDVSNLSSFLLPRMSHLSHQAIALEVLRICTSSKLIVIVKMGQYSGVCKADGHLKLAHSHDKASCAALTEAGQMQVVYARYAVANAKTAQPVRSTQPASSGRPVVHESKRRRTEAGSLQTEQSSGLNNEVPDQEACTSQVSPDSARGSKKTRLPSWKRKKMAKERKKSLQSEESELSFL